MIMVVVFVGIACVILGCFLQFPFFPCFKSIPDSALGSYIHIYSVLFEHTDSFSAKSSAEHYIHAVLRHQFRRQACSTVMLAGVRDD